MYLSPFFTPHAVNRSVRSVSSFIACVFVFLVLGSARALWAQEATVAVGPGSVVRWPGEDVELCGRGQEEWLPVEGICWYPIDLLTSEGPLEIFRQRNGSREKALVRITAYPYEVQHITLKDDSQVNLSAEDLARVRREQALVSQLWGRQGPRRFALPLHPPLDSLPESGRFGARRFFNEQPRNPHTGADYSADKGTNVLAAADGEVALAADLFFSGHSVFLDHGDGLITMYFHLSEITVKQGQQVPRGGVVGAVGQTGRATGPHLHFGIRWRRARVDPDLLLGSTEDVPYVP